MFHKQFTVKPLVHLKENHQRLKFTLSHHQTTQSMTACGSSVASQCWLVLKLVEFAREGGGFTCVQGDVGGINDLILESWQERAPL